MEGLFGVYMKRDKGIELFKSGYNCAQSVAGAFAEEMNMSLEDVLMISSPFGGGMGRMREVCGAVSGMFIVLGKLKGSKTTDPAEKKKIYEEVQILAERFKKETGSIICKELLGLLKPEGCATPDKRDETYYKKRPCVEMVALACDILESYLN